MTRTLTAALVAWLARLFVCLGRAAVVATLLSVPRTRVSDSADFFLTGVALLVAGLLLP